MQMKHYLMIAVILVVGFFIGKMKPGLIPFGNTGS